MTPPCAGKWLLFDSTEPADHLEARALCANCPIIDACRQQLALARSNTRCMARGGGPRGTWAGEFIGTPDGERFESYKARKQQGVA